VKLVFLDIDLNTWSMIVFFFYSLFLISVTLSIFSNSGNKTLFIIMIFFYLINQIVTLCYGIMTKQLGFILSVAFQFFLTLMTFIYLNQSVPVFEEDDDED
jgi:hypothetical protein